MTENSFRDPVCVMFEAPVLAAGAFKKACSAKGVDPATYRAVQGSQDKVTDTVEDVTAKDGSNENTNVGLPWTDVFDVDEDEAAEACRAIDEDVYDFHGGQNTPARGSSEGQS